MSKPETLLRTHTLTGSTANAFVISKDQLQLSPSGDGYGSCRTAVGAEAAQATKARVHLCDGEWYVPVSKRLSLSEGQLESNLSQ
ncbi:MAG: hypothetical protein HW414_666 [Dehalococcoidia bacterium]|nr:hypothetical protein [Dehalococcoidia bacterium]